MKPTMLFGSWSSLAEIEAVKVRGQPASLFPPAGYQNAEAA